MKLKEPRPYTAILLFFAVLVAFIICAAYTIHLCWPATIERTIIELEKKS
jgi:hypothetical protein